MIVLPLIERELRFQSRQSATYWLRWVGVACLVAAAVLAWIDEPFRLRQGDRLFRFLHTALFVGIWCLVPALTADVLSRERREGTLDLLFLTSLKVRDIVLAKALAQWLKAMTLVLAAVPVLIIPFLMGGVGGWQLGFALVLNGASLALALAAGLLASAMNQSRHRALVWAYLWAAFGFCLLLIGVGECVSGLMNFGTEPPRSFRVAMAWWSIFDSQTLHDLIQRRRGAIHWPQTSWTWGAILGLAGLLVWIYTVAAILALRFHRRQRVSSARVEKFERVLFNLKLAPVLYRKWMRRKLNRNPVSWLEQRTWQARLVTWTWLALLVSFYSLILTPEAAWILRSDFDAMQWTFAGLLLLSVAFTAAGSFRRERETGVLELLLVSPLHGLELVLGRLRGIWGQFLPAYFLLAGVWLFLGRTFGGGSSRGLLAGDPARCVIEVGAALLALPVIGLYFSLRCRHYLTAVAATALVLALEPFARAVVAGAIASVYRPRFSPIPISLAWIALGYWATLAYWLGRRLVACLDDHRFALRGT